MLNRWHRLNLWAKMTIIILLIVGVSAAITEWFEARSIQQTVEDNVRDAALAVGRSVDQNVLSLAQLSNRDARTKELEKILANLPDLLSIVMYEFPAETGGGPIAITSAGPTELPRQEGAPALVQRVREERRPLIDYADRPNTHRVFLLKGCRRRSNLCRVLYPANG
jgi:hypothetical protein